MLIKIDRKDAIERFPVFPLRHYDLKKDEEVFNYPHVFKNYILTLPSKSYKGHIKLMGTELVSLAKNLGFDHYIFLGDEDIPWLRRLNTYDTFQEALQYLIGQNVNKRFKGALQVDLEELPLFIKNLAWLVRTNGILPYVHFIDPGQSIVADICQYGNLHISTITNATDNEFKRVIERSSFTWLWDHQCYNKFSKSGAIKDRKPTW